MRIAHPPAGDDQAAADGGGSEKAVVTDLVNPGRGNQDGQLLDQLQGLEDHVGGPVAPAALEAVEETSVGEA